MAVVNIEIGSRTYTLSCADGEEAHITKLAGKVNERVEEISQAIGGKSNDGVILAMASLMMQDEIDDLKEKSNAVPDGESSGERANDNQDEVVSEAIDAIADYVDTIAERIEKG